MPTSSVAVATERSNAKPGPASWLQSSNVQAHPVNESPRLPGLRGLLPVNNLDDAAILGVDDYSNVAPKRFDFPWDERHLPSAPSQLCDNLPLPATENSVILEAFASDPLGVASISNGHLQALSLIPRNVEGTAATLTRLFRPWPEEDLAGAVPNDAGDALGFMPTSVGETRSLMPFAAKLIKLCIRMSVKETG